MLITISTESNQSIQIERLYMKHERLLKSVISKHLTNQEDIEDCLQDTFVYFLQNKHKIKYSTPKETKNYLATIANGLAINKYKKNCKEVLVDEYEIYEGNEFAMCSDTVFDKASVSELFMLIEKLDERDKNYIYLTYIYGYTSGEIAELCEVKSSFVRKRLERAKSYLRGELSKN